MRCAMVTVLLLMISVQLWSGERQVRVIDDARSVREFKSMVHAYPRVTIITRDHKKVIWFGSYLIEN